ncbi:MAG: SpoIIE family protein phosphatase [Acidimicrobiales bacterium]|nr:SpoIIE family protein phosphatase [Acidimicrobiales bacterium]
MTASSRPLEWSASGRPLPGEPESGDIAVCVEGGEHTVVAVIDGLGHGTEAAEAASRVRDVIVRQPDQPVEMLLSLAHEALARTRGAAVTIASIDDRGTMRWVGVGNVEGLVLRLDGHRPRRAASATLYGGVVGYRLPRTRVSTVALEPGDVVVMATDGITPDFADDVALGSPIDRLVSTILDRSARPNDDALVAAVRYGGRP